MSSVSPFIGIDFGTSKSAMSWYNPKTGQAEVINNYEGKPETPSVVYLGKGEGEVVAGDLAERKLREGTVDQHNLVVSVKRNLITAATKVLDENRKYRPVNLAAIILRKLREDAQTQHFHEPVTRAVITHPASFGPLHQDKIKQAAQLAGFTEVRLLPEPVAAALAYGYSGLNAGNSILVYDFGGGTFDVAALTRISENSFRWAAEPRGLETCGGDDLDRELYNYCEEVAHQKIHRGISLNGDIDFKFLFLCRDRKENLSYFEEETFSSYLPSNNGPVQFEHTLKREMFEERIRKYIDQTVSLTRNVMSEARANRCTIDTIVLIGGSSRIPMVIHSLSGMLSMEPTEWQQRDFAVSLGAAYFGAQIWPTSLTRTLPPQPPSPPPPPPPPSPPPQATILAEAYAQAARSAWEPTKKLTSAQVNELTALAGKLGLKADVTKGIESAIMGHTKEDDLALQHYAALAEYRSAVMREWSDKVLTGAKMNMLVALANGSGLRKNEIIAVEQEIMGSAKEVIWERQRHGSALGEYRETVQKAWELNRALTESQVTELVSKIKNLGLSREEAATIERQIMGDTKEAILDRQRRYANLHEYRSIVKNTWEQTRGLTQTQFNELTVQMQRLGLSREEASTIEHEVMGNTKEAFLVGVLPPKRKWRWTIGKVIALILVIFCGLGFIGGISEGTSDGATTGIVFLILTVLCLIWLFRKPKPKMPKPVSQKPPTMNLPKQKQSRRAKHE